MLYRYATRLVRVVDGDTIVLDIDLGFHVHNIQTVRLFGVNTPETRGVNARPEGIVARDFTAAWLADRNDLVLHSRRYDDREKYGRVLGTIYRGDEPESLNNALLRTGNAVIA